jgi:hypothetical protein
VGLVTSHGPELPNYSARWGRLLARTVRGGVYERAGINEGRSVSGSPY